MASAKAYRLSEERNDGQNSSGELPQYPGSSIAAKSGIFAGRLEGWPGTLKKPSRENPRNSCVRSTRFAACLVESHLGNFAEARNRFVVVAPNLPLDSKLETRDYLGDLAAAEAHLQAGDLAGSRETALKGANQPGSHRREASTYGPGATPLCNDQPKEGDAVAARGQVKEAIKSRDVVRRRIPGVSVPTRDSA